MFPSFSKRLIGLLTLATFLFALSTFYTSTSSLKSSFGLSSILHTCSPADYSDGEWAYSPHTAKSNMTQQEDALTFSGFTGCASSREFFWHLAADKKEQWDRFPGAQSWKWVPGQKCTGLRPLDARELIKDLVEDGGWYLVGDSVMENQFFSLSCILHGHVIATPDYTTGESWDRGWPQNLYLAPTSPLVASINFPVNFDITKTPLITFRRIDILFSKEELIQIHREIQPPGTILEDDSLFGEQAVWTLPFSEYNTEFTAPLPRGNYKTMVVSTAGHWTVETFSKTSPPGIDGVLNLFKHAMERWAEKVQAHIKTSDQAAGLTWRLGPLAKKARRKRVVVRAYLPGHEDCHSFREPWKISSLSNGIGGIGAKSPNSMIFLISSCLTERSIPISTTLVLTGLLGCVLIRTPQGIVFTSWQVQGYWKAGRITFGITLQESCDRHPVRYGD